MSVFQNCFQDKTVLVTGGGRGIGRAVAVELYKCGAKVYALSKNPDNLEALEAECPGIVTISVDLVDWDATRAAVSAIPELIHCLVNCAGIMKLCPFMDINMEDFELTMDINLKAVINVSQVFAGKLIEAGKPGSIVHISSVAGRKGFATGGIYSTTKAGLEMLSKVMAVELGKHSIRVNCVNPGTVDTDLVRNASKELSPEEIEKMMSSVQERTPLGNIIMPMGEVVNTILFLLSDLGGQITGDNLAICGGYLVG